MKRENGRTSFLSRKKERRESLLRFVVIDGEIYPDPKQEMKGRGYYLLEEEIQLAIEKKAFNRIVHRPLTEIEIERIKAHGKKK